MTSMRNKVPRIAKQDLLKNKILNSAHHYSHRIAYGKWKTWTMKRKKYRKMPPILITLLTRRESDKTQKDQRFMRKAKMSLYSKT